MPQQQPTLLAAQPIILKDGTMSQAFRTHMRRLAAAVVIAGEGSPEGVVEAPQYSLYIDEATPDNPVYYRKMLVDVGGDGSKGWIDALTLSVLTFGTAVGGDITAETITAESLTLTGDDNLKLTGDATVWDDIQTSLIGRRLASTSGTVAYNYAENTIDFSAGGVITSTNDTVVFNLQAKHAALVDSELQLHMHFVQSDAINRTMTVRYRIQDNGEAKTTGWTTITANTSNAVWSYPGGTFNNILPLTDISLEGHTLSCVIQIQMTRTDAAAGLLPITFVDARYEIDSLGSRERFVK